MTKPLIRFDGGWLYVIAGLLVCMTGILVPVEQDLRDLRGQLQAMQSREYMTSLHLGATSQVLDQLDAGDPALLKRLASSQLNIVPASTTPILRSSVPPLPLSEWVKDSIRDKRPEIVPPNRSLLTSLTSGKKRLWVFGLGVLCVFFGLLFDPALSAVNHIRSLRLTRRRSSRRQLEAVALEMTRSVQSPRTQSPRTQSPRTQSPRPQSPRSAGQYEHEYDDVNANETTPELGICEEQWRAADSEIEMDDLESTIADVQDDLEDPIEPGETKTIQPLVEIDLAEEGEYEDEGEDVVEGSLGEESDEDEDDDEEGEYEYVYVDEDGNEIAEEDLADYEEV